MKSVKTESNDLKDASGHFVVLGNQRISSNLPARAYHGATNVL